MAKYNVKTTAVINNNPVGSTIELPKATVDKLIAKGYVEVIGEVKPKSKPKSKTTKKAAAPKKASKGKAEDSDGVK